MMSSNLATQLSWASHSLTAQSRKVLDMSNTSDLSHPTLYTVEEAAEQLRVSRWMIYRLLRSNELKSLTIASRRLIASDDLVDFIKQQKEGFYE